MTSSETSARTSRYRALVEAKIKKEVGIRRRSTLICCRRIAVNAGHPFNGANGHPFREARDYVDLLVAGEDVHRKHHIGYAVTTLFPDKLSKTWRDHLQVAAQVAAIVAAIAGVTVAFITVSNHRGAVGKDPPEISRKP